MAVAVVRFILKFFGVLLGLITTAAVAVVVFTLTLVPDLPSIESFKDVPLKVPLRVYTTHGRLMAEFGEERREPVAIAQVPDTLINAILAAEDDRFYSHPGVDFAGVMRAALANLQSGTHEQGASTITMQVARNYFLTREKTYTRKMREALLAFRLERALSKDQILELYVNKIFLGHRAYGFAAAARIYYGKALDELSVPQMAMLAGLPKAWPHRSPRASMPCRPTSTHPTWPKWCAITCWKHMGRKLTGAVSMFIQRWWVAYSIPLNACCERD